MSARDAIFSSSFLDISGVKLFRKTPTALSPICEPSYWNNILFMVLSGLLDFNGPGPESRMYTTKLDTVAA